MPSREKYSVLPIKKMLNLVLRMEKKAVIVNLNFSISKTTVIPSFIAGNVYRFRSAITRPGGKGVNVSRALRILGIRAPLAGFISGFNGAWIRTALKREDFDFILERHRNGESRVCYTITDPQGISTDINEDGPDVPAHSQEHFLKRFLKSIPEYGVMAICGRMPSGIKPGFYGKIVKAALEKKCKVIVDTSGQSLRETLRAGANAFKINRYEFEELSGTRFSQENLRKFIDGRFYPNLSTVIVTDGPNYSYAMDLSGSWRIIPPALRRLKSTTGAGDSFMAGFLYGYLTDVDFEQCLKLGTGTAASDCLTVGAGVIKKDLVLSFADKAKIIKIN